jgi:acyl CoA:acetate/3-ketoacid CoA transferase beta subunit
MEKLSFNGKGAVVLTSEQIAQRAAREIRNNDRIYVDLGLAAKVKSYLPEDGCVLCDSSSPVDIAFISAVKVCNRRKFIQPPPTNGQRQSKLSPIPVRGSRQTIILIPHTQDGTDWLVDERGNNVEADALRMSCRIITDLAVIDMTDMGLIVREVASGVSACDVQKTTEVPLIAGPDLCKLQV